MYALMQVYSEYIKSSILCMLTVMNKWCVCLCCVILSWQISTTGRTTDLTDTWLAKWAKWASWTHRIRLGALQRLVALNRTDRARRTPDLRLGPWILIGSFGLTSVWEHCWHTQSFPLNVTLSPMGKGLLRRWKIHIQRERIRKQAHNRRKNACSDCVCSHYKQAYT